MKKNLKNKGGKVDLNTQRRTTPLKDDSSSLSDNKEIVRKVKINAIQSKYEGRFF